MKIKKVISVFCIILILSLFICTLIAALTNSPNFMAYVFLSLIVPLILYVFLWLYKLAQMLKSDNSKKEEN